MERMYWAVRHMIEANGGLLSPEEAEIADAFNAMEWGKQVTYQEVL